MIFVAVGSSPSNTNTVMVSSNGTVWTAYTSSSDSNSWSDVCWSPDLSLFVAVAGASDSQRLMTSPDGRNWTAVTVGAVGWTGICWAPELSIFVAVASVGSITMRSDYGLPNSLNAPLATSGQLTVSSSTGNVGIGTTVTTSAKLNVNGTLSISSNVANTYTANTLPASSDFPLTIENINTATTANISTGLRFQIARTEALGSGGRVICDQRLFRKTAATSDGSIIWSGYTNAATNPSYQDVMELNTHTSALTIRGDIISFGTLSDARLKKKLSDITNALERITKLLPLEYTWRDDVPNTTKRNTLDVGLIAQDVDPLFPMVTTTLTDGYQGIKYEKLIPYIIQSIQDLHSEVRAIRERISARIQASR
jgi:hypothetical protein